MVAVPVPTVAPEPPALHCMEHSKAVIPTHPMHQMATQGPALHSAPAAASVAAVLRGAVQSGVCSAIHSVSATELQAKIDLLNDQQFDSVMDFLMPDLGDSEGQLVELDLDTLLPERQLALVERVDELLYARNPYAEGDESSLASAESDGNSSASCEGVNPLDCVYDAIAEYQGSAPYQGVLEACGLSPAILDEALECWRAMGVISVNGECIELHERLGGTSCEHCLSSSCTSHD